MNIHLILGIISGILAALAIIPYIKDILHGSTRPNIVSWALWVLLLGISILAQWSAGASWSLIFLIGDFIGTSAVLILCLTGYGYSKYTWVEWTCLALAVIAIIAWQLAHQPVLAILFAIIADLMASVPTVVKAYRDPWSEDPSVWIIICIASLLGIFSTTIFNAANLIFPAYIFFINGLIGLLSLIGRRSKPKSING
jgi:hypothetical protein